MIRIVLSLLAAIGVSAPVWVSGPVWAADAVQLSYDMHAAGFHAARIKAGFRMEPQTYQATIAYRTTGIVGFFFRGHQLTTVEGRWQADSPEPSMFVSKGTSRGEDRLTRLEYDRRHPIVRQLIPPNEAERERVPPDIQANTTDTLSAVVGLLRSVARSGRCEAIAHTFDGRRAAVIQTHSAGTETLPPTPLSSFAGEALRCDFESRMVAGFYHGDATRKPLTGSIWLARPRAGVPPVPVRMTFETRWFGEATLYLVTAALSDDSSIAAY